MLEKRSGQPERPTPETEPEVASFIAFLNQLFDALAVSLTRYAARVSRDKGSLSRYLNGRRIAPKDFVDELLRQVADLTGSPVTDHVRIHAHQLRLEALRVRNASQHELEQLRESLGAAERELHLANVRERALLRAVEAAEEQTRQAEKRYRQLESDWATAHYTSGSSELDLYAQPDGADELRDEIRGLKAELEALRIELSRAQALKHDAEEQCLRLEARLLAAEAALKAERAGARDKAAAAELQVAHPEDADPDVFHRIVAAVNAANNLADTLHAVVEGAVRELGFDAVGLSLVRHDGDLVMAAVWKTEEHDMGGPSGLLGKVGSRASWDRLLGACDHWGTLRFLPHDRGWAVGSDVPVLTGDGPLPTHADDWHPQDMLFAPMYNADGDLIGVLSVDRPRSGKRSGEWTRETLERFALQASLTIGNARLRAETERTLSRLEREHEALRSSEESFRQAFEYGPTAMAITELRGDAMGQLTRVNDALCRLLGQPRAVLRQQRFADLVHPDDLELFRRISAEAGRADLRLTRRDGGYQRVRLRNSIVADAAEGPRFLMTVVEDMDEWKHGQLVAPGTPDPDHTMNRQ
ncbi:PAS domain S-box protein [Kitasatospora aburaviensis]|uniref:PAS domain S-box protein n=1 Tax=Kitasatospora aburaviensis TaxID=67265 RepID=A0ABW1F134_9ACTN